MLLETQGNFWYNLEGHTTRTSGHMAGESDFCRFSRNEAPNQPKANFGWSKKLFENSDKAWFLARRLRSTHFLGVSCI